MNTLNHRRANELADLYQRVVDLERQIRQIPSRQAKLAPAALTLQVIQAAHGFTVGKAVSIDSGSWALFSDLGSVAYSSARPLWGIVSAVTSPDAFCLTIGGEGITTSTSLGAGYYYTFQNGDPVLIEGSYPPFDGKGSGIAVMAMSATSVIVANDGRYDGLQSHDGTYAVVAHPDIVAGHYVVYAGVPSGESPLAIADEDNPWKWTNVGIALFEVGTAGVWLVLVAGTHSWSIFGSGDVRPAWLLTTPYNAGQRIYLSTTNPGQYATSAPAFKVYAGISSASYLSDTTTFSAVAVGQGVPYPIPASGGGTGTDVSLIAEHSLLFLDTYGTPSSRKIAGLLSATATHSVIAQKNGEPPTHLLLDLAADGSFELETGTLYTRVCGKRSGTTAPVDKMFLRYNGTTWEGYGPLLDSVGQLLSHDGTDLVTIDASTPQSVLGVAGATAAAPEPIQATDDGFIFGRLAGALTFAAPTDFGISGGGGVSGRSASIITALGSGSFTVPAGVYRIRCVVIGGGGGSGATSGGSKTLGWVASSSGGIPNTALVASSSNYSKGGSAACMIAELDVTPGQTISYTVGAGGAETAFGTPPWNGGNGGTSSVTYGTLTLLATGGEGGRDAASSYNDAASGGVCEIVGNVSTYQAWALGLPGQKGEPTSWGLAGVSSFWSGGDTYSAGVVINSASPSLGYGGSSQPGVVAFYW